MEHIENGTDENTQGSTEGTETKVTKKVPVIAPSLLAAAAASGVDLNDENGKPLTSAKLAKAIAIKAREVAKAERENASANRIANREANKANRESRTANREANKGARETKAKARYETRIKKVTEALALAQSNFDAVVAGGVSVAKPLSAPRADTKAGAIWAIIDADYTDTCIMPSIVRTIELCKAAGLDSSESSIKSKYRKFVKFEAEKDAKAKAENAADHEAEVAGDTAEA